ncbi:hypothetical protein QYE76_055796 [Lolium multiflorum]|uniref:Uncharacterized protein n=1 Tax=Lolium multiflorum TaxID=4521 RepID=A0AAD8T117_LOLMU|nr:hypothetical protein QYE76_055796 [Lolium multiflorum]
MEAGTPAVEEVPPHAQEAVARDPTPEQQAERGPWNASRGRRSRRPPLRDADSRREPVPQSELVELVLLAVGQCHGNGLLLENVRWLGLQISRRPAVVVVVVCHVHVLVCVLLVILFFFCGDLAVEVVHVTEVVSAAACVELPRGPVRGPSGHFARPRSESAETSLCVAAAQSLCVVWRWCQTHGHGGHKRSLGVRLCRAAGDALVTAASRGDLQNIQLDQLLLTKRTCLRGRDQYGLTALHMAAIKGHCDVIALLAGSGCMDMECEDVEGHRPLHLAVEGGCAGAVDLLLDMGADVHAPSGTRRRSRWRRRWGYDDIAQPGRRRGGSCCAVVHCVVVFLVDIVCLGQSSFVFASSIQSCL